MKETSRGTPIALGIGRLIPIFAGVVMLLAGCSEQTADDLHAQHRDAARSGIRYVEQQARRIHLRDPTVVDVRRDAGCAIMPADYPWGDHQFRCEAIEDVFAMGAAADVRGPVASMAASAQAAGWSFIHAALPGQPQVVTDTREPYDEYQRDPSRTPLLPIGMERSDTGQWVTLSLIVVTSADPGPVGLSSEQRAAIDRYTADVRAGRSLYGFEIDLRYAWGTCTNCSDSP